ncbi:heme exporter protein A [Natronocella acetinitrilica]|uniref:Heme exporter protein A n=1 Tax=Natronocella acetinitrilica TaxID=414046 RepID=A0AAE3KH10_9GAMM|nr:cytochrome c biogenesis heme-transporting ATPase CcmA [Natronocella acetinitrilica]MCP1675847.1 heme exporter protein A [Natronocella acetinitrilica]
MQDIVFEADRLACIRGERMLFDGLSFRLEAGHGLLVTGHNGCGKTSLLRILCGLSLPEDGEVRWRGTDIREDRSAYFRDMAYIGHANGVKADLTVAENLRVSLALTTGGPMDLIDAALDDVGLVGLASEPAGALSAGQCRRLALARLLVSRAALWIVDEPFNALDQTGVLQVESLISRHLADGGLVIMTSHQPLKTLGDSLEQLRMAA